MDNYPLEIAPEFDEGGGIITPFDVWWEKAKDFYTNVPEEVAKYWVHEHWNHSPYSWLISKNYEFKEVDWPLNEVGKIRSRLSNFDVGGAECKEHGDYLLTLTEYKTSCYMQKFGGPPVGVVVADNRDGHFAKDYRGLEACRIPSGYILIEGHRRYSLALALNGKNRLQTFKVWLMCKSKNA